VCALGRSEAASSMSHAILKDETEKSVELRSRESAGRTFRRNVAQGDLVGPAVSHSTCV